MELKRYVMLNKEIYEVERVLENDVKHVYFKAVGEEYNRTIYDGDVYKTSDNILDLVEMADLVEVDYLNGLLNRNGSEVRIHKIELVQLVVKDVSGKTKIIIDMTEDSNKTVKPECVIAIYKRQPNGDYKKYEVK